MFKLAFTSEAKEQLKALESDEKKLKKVRRCLGLIESDPRRPGLNSHSYRSLRGRNGETVWQSYVENRTPAAWRVFWHYGPGEDQITIIAIRPHP